MLLPNGQQAGNMDRVMLLSMWVSHLQENNVQIIKAGMGKPTYPMNEDALEAMQAYIEKLRVTARKANSILYKIKPNDKKDQVVKLDAASSYGGVQGEFETRKKMAEALTNWYSGQTINPDDLLFTVGGVAALHNIFEVINKKIPNGRIVTPFPYYSLYPGMDHQNNLHPIHVMKEKGYKLTAHALEKSIKEAEKKAALDGFPMSAFLFCDPNNPLGTVIDDEEWKKIADVLRRYPDIPIILDEAYAEMRLDCKRSSLLTIAPDLKDRIVLIRSATKALSAAGERMAVMVCSNKALMAKLVSENIAINGHAPRLLQEAFAVAMREIIGEHETLIDYYRPGVEYVFARARNMGANMPDPNYKVEGTFYVMVDLSDLIGAPLSENAKIALGENSSDKISTDNDIVYSLLFDNNVMVGAGSYCGLDAKAGFIRITTSGGDTELKDLMDRIEYRLRLARIEKFDALKKRIEETLNHPNLDYLQEIKQEYSHYLYHLQNLDANQLSTLDLKERNNKMQSILAELKLNIDRSDPMRAEKAAYKIQSFFQSYQRKKATRELVEIKKQKWKEWVDLNLDGSLEFKKCDALKQNRIPLWQKEWTSYIEQNGLWKKHLDHNTSRKHVQNTSGSMFIPNKKLKSITPLSLDDSTGAESLPSSPLQPEANQYSFFTPPSSPTPSNITLPEGSPQKSSILKKRILSSTLHH